MFTVSRLLRDKKIRNFWGAPPISPGASRRPTAKGPGLALLNNVWIRDGYKVIPADRETRARF
jgi:L-rhamnose isomerase